MSRHPPRPAASRSRSPSGHGPTPYNPPLTLGTIESAEFFTRWRPVILMVNFDALSRLEEARNGGLLNQSREQVAPALRSEEERAIFTFTKILQTHQLNMLFGTLEAEVLYQVEQTWGVDFPSEEIKLTIPDHTQYRRLLLPADMTVREALDRYRTRWHQEQSSAYTFLAHSRKGLLHIPSALIANVIPMLFGFGTIVTTAPRQEKCCSMRLAATPNIRSQ